MEDIEGGHCKPELNVKIFLLKHYIGCEIEYLDLFTDTWNRGKLRGVIDNCGFVENNNHGIEFEHIKPILFRLRDMTIEHIKECGNIDYDFTGDPIGDHVTWEYFDTLITPNQFEYIISKEYWLFGDEAFNEGLIIDKKLYNEKLS